MPRTSLKKNIVIAGGGFGGITAALHLSKALRRFPALAERYRLILVNNHHSHLYTPALYEIAAIPQGEHSLKYVKSSVTIPLADIFYGTLVEWQENEILRIEREKKELTFANTKTLPFEYLILALGAETSYFNIPGAEEHGFPLKTFADAVRLRDRIQTAIETNQPILSIVVAGAGASGVEVAAEFENFVCTLRSQHHARQICRVRVTLVEATGDILSGFAPWVVAQARRRLAHLGVQIKTNALITAVGGEKIDLKDGTSLPYDILAWTGGVRAAGVLQTLNLPLTAKGSILVNQYLEAAPQIYAIGDNAAFTAPGAEHPLPWNVPVAESEARRAAANIISELRGKEKIAFRPAARYPFILAVGSTYAIADLVYFRLAGRVAWILKQLVELRYFLFILSFFQALETWWRAFRVARSNDTTDAVTPSDLFQR